MPPYGRHRDTRATPGAAERYGCVSRIAPNICAPRVQNARNRKSGLLPRREDEQAALIRRVRQGCQDHRPWSPERGNRPCRYPLTTTPPSRRSAPPSGRTSPGRGGEASSREAIGTSTASAAPKTAESPMSCSRPPTAGQPQHLLRAGSARSERRKENAINPSPGNATHLAHS